jgi:hypothetical protein
MARRRFKTEADIARYVKDGFGQGEGSSYKPWVRVQDVPSTGRSRKILGIKSGRIHHTLSDLEYNYFLLLEFSDEVIDIREQYPLLASTRARDIAAEMGIRYPMYVGTQLPFVLTSDFVLTIQEPNGKKRLAVRTCKYEKELADPGKASRTIEKLELEKAIWADKGVIDWKIVTDKLVSPMLRDNLDWLRRSGLEGEIAVEEETQLQFAAMAIRAADGVRTLSSIVRSVSSAIGIPYRQGTSLFKYLVWNKFILTDLSAAPLDLTLPCPLLRAADTGTVAQAARQQRVA